MSRFIHIGRLELVVSAKRRKPGIREAYMKVGKPVTIGGQLFWQVADADYQAIRKQFALNKPPRPGRALLPQSHPSAPPKLPGPLVTLANAAGAAKRVITAAATDQQIQVTEVDFHSRMSICRACEFFIPKKQRCAKCSCFLASQIIGKARLATETCPESKWPQLRS